MKSNQQDNSLRNALLLAALAGIGTAMTPLAAKAEPDPPAAGEVQVGDATRKLLATQQAGTNASTTPRPIPGEIASRSYQRYLKSFEREIPERFNSTVKGSAGGGGTSR